MEENGFSVPLLAPPPCKGTYFKCRKLVAFSIRTVVAEIPTKRSSDHSTLSDDRTICISKSMLSDDRFKLIFRSDNVCNMLTASSRFICFSSLKIFQRCRFITGVDVDKNVNMDMDIDMDMEADMTMKVFALSLQKLDFAKKIITLLLHS
jgi:hypothetical protein